MKERRRRRKRLTLVGASAAFSTGGGRNRAWAPSPRFPTEGQLRNFRYVCDLASRDRPALSLRCG
jgi:hypothetical protein